MKSIFTTLFVAIAFMAFSQDYMDKIAVASCECIDNVSDTIPTDQFNMELGLCMLEASMPYKKQLKKDHGINFDKIESQGEKLGRLIGIKLASTCPNSLMRMVKKVNPELDFEEDEEIADENNVKVAVKEKLDNNQFGQASDFFRTDVKKYKIFYHHVGIYAFTNKALVRYVSLKRSKLELETLNSVLSDDISVILKVGEPIIKLLKKL